KETFTHPFRDPGYTAANLLSLIPGVGGVVGKALEAGRLVEGAGALAPKLAESMDALKAANPGMSDYEAANKLGRGASYTRAYRDVTEGAGERTFEPRPVGHQLIQTLLYGTPKEERILTTGGGSALDTLLGT